MDEFATTAIKIAEDNQRLRARVADLELELRNWFGCPSCMERHDKSVMCPPHEMRTSGQAWFHRALSEAKQREDKQADRIAKLEAAFGKWHCPQCGDTGFLDGIGDSCDACPVGFNAELRAALIRVENLARESLAADVMRHKAIHAERKD